MHNAAPNTAPERVGASRLNATHMNVSWVKLTLEEARGFVTGYTISIDTLETRRKRAVRMEMIHPDSSNKLIGGLGFTESYSVTVSARTTAGDGISSSAILLYGKHCSLVQLLKLLLFIFNSSDILYIPTENQWNK